MSLSLRKPQPILWLAPVVLLLVTAEPQTQKVVAQGATATQKVVAKAAQDVQQGVVDIWEGGTNSLVAIAVGSAEGTRRPDGGKNPAYKGHVDPGNGAWNLGTFSYQGCPGGCALEEADRRQLARLKSQAEVIDKQAGGKDNLNLIEKLNFIDLANQSPLAALDGSGAAKRLDEAKKKGLKGKSAVLDARVNAYRNPTTGRLEAGGLGGEADVQHDQGRRMDRIDDAIAAKKLTGKEQVK